MSSWDRKNKTLFAILLAVIVGISAGYALALSPTFGTIIQPGSQTEGPSWVVFTDGTNCFARNGFTASIDSSGSNCRTVIQYALNNAPLPGGQVGTVLLKAGSYSISASGTAITMGNFDGETLAGEGPNTILNFQSGVGYAILLQSDRETVRDLQITGSFTSAGVAYASAGNQNFTVQNVVIVGGGDNFGQISFVQTKNVRIVGNTLIAGAGVAIRAQSDTGIWIHGNKIIKAKDDGVLTMSDQEEIIADNDFIDTPWNTLDHSAIFVNNGQGTNANARTISIVGNTIRWDQNPTPARVYGIVVDGEEAFASYVNDTSIVGNSITGFGQGNLHGIYVHIRSSPSVLRNVWNVTISGNTISNWTGFGISASGDLITISGNSLVGNNMGIWFWGTQNSTIVGNTIIGNTKSANNDGIRLAYSAKPTVYTTVIANRIVTFDRCITEPFTGYNAGNLNLIEQNYVTNCNTGVNAAGAGTIVRWNTGYTTEKSGTATISASTSVTFNHGLVTNAAIVFASFSTTACGAWQWSSTSTQITVTVATSCSATVYWYAQTWTG